MDLLNMRMVGFSNFRGGCKTCTSQRGAVKFFYAERSSEDEQLLTRPRLRESENMNVAGG
jgi:hypothetical protein